METIDLDDDNWDEANDSGMEIVKTKPPKPPPASKAAIAGLSSASTSTSGPAYQCKRESREEAPSRS